MLIPVLTEPDFRSYLWAKQTMDGVLQEAARRKYRVTPIDSDNYQTIDYDSLFEDGRRLLIVIGTSVSWMPKALAFFESHGIESIFISYDPSESLQPAGIARMDYVGATHHLIAYLNTCGRSRIAMYGYNPNSSADNIKLRFFREYYRQEGQPTEDRIFYNYASLTDCYESFRPQASRFDAVICANDIVAVSMLSFLKRDGISVPDDLFLTAFGDSMIAARVKPSLTIATLDPKEVGRQAVLQFSSIYKQTGIANVSVRVRSHLIIRESTSMIPDTIDFKVLDSKEYESAQKIKFYSDPEAERLLRAETLLNACDESDLQLIVGLIDGTSLENMKEQLYLTASALQYRRKRLMNAAQCESNADFFEFLTFCRDKGII